MDNVDNISFSLDDDNNVNEVNIGELLNNFENLNNNISTVNDEIYVKMKNYELNYNVKQLSLICEYYGISKFAKMKKSDIIEQIILFEHNFENISVVIRRNELWNYMSELKNDKFLKKFVIWS